MRVAVTGSQGFLGWHVVEALLARGDSVVGLDALTYAGDPAAHAGHPRFELIRGDLAQMTASAIVQLGIVDAIVHLAAESHVDNSLVGPWTAVRTNVLGTLATLELARSLAVPIVAMSTDEVTGDVPADGLPTDECSYIKASSPYSASKAGAELLALAYHRSYGVDVRVVRSTNLFGPRQHPEKLIPRAITYALDGRKFPVFGDGLQRRDWLYVEDGARGVVAALDRGAAGRVYCLGSRWELTNRNVLSHVRHCLPTGIKLELDFVTDRQGHDTRYATNPSRAEHELGWYATWKFGPAVDETVNWYATHEEWWRGAVARGGRW